MFGGARVGIVNFDKNTCPYRLHSSWRHSVRGKLEKDTGIVMACANPTLGIYSTLTKKSYRPL